MHPFGVPCLRSDAGDDASSSSFPSGKKDVAEIIVVDNHSSDGSLEYLQRRYPREAYPMVRFVGSNHNLGLLEPTISPSVRAKRSMYSF